MACLTERNVFMVALCCSMYQFFISFCVVYVCGASCEYLGLDPTHTHVGSRSRFSLHLTALRRSAEPKLALTVHWTTSSWDLSVSSSLRQAVRFTLCPVCRIGAGVLTQVLLAIEKCFSSVSHLLGPTLFLFVARMAPYLSIY